MEDKHEDLMELLMEAHQPVKQERPPRPWFNRRKQHLHQQRETTHTISNVAIGELVRADAGTVGLFEIKEGCDQRKAQIYISKTAIVAKGKVATSIFTGVSQTGQVLRIIRVVVVTTGSPYPSNTTAPAPNLPHGGLCNKCGYRRPPLKEMLTERKRKNKEQNTK